MNDDFVSRIIEEKAELDLKIEKLEKFIDSHEYIPVESDEKQRLSLQLIAMTRYSFILSERLEYHKYKML